MVGGHELGRESDSDRDANDVYPRHAVGWMFFTDGHLCEQTVRMKTLPTVNRDSSY